MIYVGSLAITNENTVPGIILGYIDEGSSTYFTVSLQTPLPPSSSGITINAQLLLFPCQTFYLSHNCI